MPIPTNDVCQVCSEEFKAKELLIVVTRWRHETEAPFFAHVDCALIDSQREERKHPPKLKPR